MSDPTAKQFASLIQSLELKEIITISLNSRRFKNPESGKEVKFNWKQASAQNTPEKNSDGTLVYQVKFDAEALQEDTPILTHATEFAIIFETKNVEQFDEAWQNKKIQEVFFAQQITFTVWPLFRQNVYDAMSRLGLNPITLPWLHRRNLS